MNTELSRAMSSRTPVGKSRCSSGSMACTLRDRSSGLAVALCTSATLTESRPFRRERPRVSAGPWWMRATSPRRTGAPCTVLSTTAANCSGVRSVVREVTSNSRSSDSTRPAGASRLLASSALSTSPTVS